MKTFFKTLRTSFYSSELYTNARNNSTSKGIVFLLKTVVFLGIILGIVGLVFLIVGGSFVRKQILPLATTMYPEGLEITIKDKTLSINQPAPVLIPVPLSWVDDTKKETPKNLLVINPEISPTVEVFREADTMVFLGKNTLLAGDESEQIRIIPYTDEWSGTLTKSKLIGFAGSVFKIAQWIVIPVIIPTTIFIFGVFAFIELLWLFISALLVWGLFSLRKVPLSYKEAYRIGVYTIAPILILKTILFPFAVSGGIVFSTAVTLLIAWYASREWKKEEVKNTSSSSVETEAQKQE